MTFTDPSLQSVTIKDFSPGVFQFSRGSYPVTYAPLAPLGSAAYAYRCINQPGVGLIPLPKYSSVRSFTDTAIWMVNGMMEVQGGGAVVVLVTEHAANLASNLVQVSSGSATSVYSTTPANEVSYPSLNPACNVAPYYLTSSNDGQCAFVDNFNTVPQLVCVDLTSLAVTSVAAPNPTTLIAAANSRLALMVFGGVYTTDVEALTGIVGPELFFPEYYASAGFGTCGSISTGEFFFVYNGGGGVIVNGDIQAPSSAIVLPGIVGPGANRGLAVPTPMGLVYATDLDGAYLWDGGNTAQKISQQIPDDQLARPTNSVTQAGNIVPPNCNALFGHLLFCANNWVFDTLNNSWWQCENPGTLTLSVHARSFNSIGTFWSVSPEHGNNSAFTVYKWNAATPQSSWVWQSNPILSAAGLVSVQNIEIVASNPTATPATIIVTPEPPAGQTAYPNQDPSQPLTFTIPPFSSAWRGSQRLGYNDYNLQLNVSASNTNAANAAPTLHEITATYDTRNAAIA